jgi:hypothetical protein
MSNTPYCSKKVPSRVKKSCGMNRDSFEVADEADKCSDESGRAKALTPKEQLHEDAIVEILVFKALRL